MKDLKQRPQGARFPRVEEELVLYIYTVLQIQFTYFLCRIEVSTVHGQASLTAGIPHHVIFQVDISAAALNITRFDHAN